MANWKRRLLFLVGFIMAFGSRPLAGASGQAVGAPVRSGGFADPADFTGFYILFAPAGEQFLTAAWGSLADTQPVAVYIDGVTWQDFLLPVVLRWLPGVVK